LNGELAQRKLPKPAMAMLGTITRLAILRKQRQTISSPPPRKALPQA
jgi:hypothetical protein